MVPCRRTMCRVLFGTGRHSVTARSGSSVFPWRRIVGLAFVAASLPFSAASLAQEDAMKHQGRWAYSDSPTAGGKASWVAMTPAAETGDVWLSFWCSADPQVLASIYNKRGVAGSDVAVDITLQDGEAFRVPLLSVNDQVGIFPAALSERLFLYAAHAERLRIAVPDRRGSVNSYTFLFQPSDMALKIIVDGCIDRRGARTP